VKTPRCGFALRCATAHPIPSASPSRRATMPDLFVVARTTAIDPASEGLLRAAPSRRRIRQPLRLAARAFARALGRPQARGRNHLSSARRL